MENTWNTLSYGLIWYYILCYRLNHQLPAIRYFPTARMQTGGKCHMQDIHFSTYDFCSHKASIVNLFICAARTCTQLDYIHLLTQMVFFQNWPSWVLSFGIFWGPNWPSPLCPAVRWHRWHARRTQCSEALRNPTPANVPMPTMSNMQDHNPTTAPCCAAKHQGIGANEKNIVIHV